MSELDLQDLSFLLGSEGRRLLSSLGQTRITPENHLQIASKLREQIDPKKASALLETILLRQRAVKKFSRASEMFYTRSALEQASAEIVSKYRAKRFFEMGFRNVADLCCGIAGDSISLSARLDVTGVDWDPLRLAMADVNVDVYGNAERFSTIKADLSTMSPLTVEALFSDPGRRDENGRRLYSLDKYRPPISFLDAWRKTVPHGAVKVSPGIDYAEIPADAEVEFISVAGEVREAVLWFGDLRTKARRRATLLPGHHTLTDVAIEERNISKPNNFLYEPDGAVIRAQLVTHLAHILNAARLDPEIAYLTSDQAVESPFARIYSINDAMPFNLKILRSYLRDRRIGRVTIKKRGSPIDPDALRSWLRLRGDGHCVIFLTHVMGAPTVLIGQRLAGAG